MSKGDREHDFYKRMFEQIRTEQKSMSPKNPLNEAEDKENNENGKAIAITNGARFGQNVLQNQIDGFKKAVNLGAKFSKENEEEPENNPLVFFPKSENLIFSGSIPNMAGLKFQFSLNDVTDAPYIFVDGLSLTEDVVNTINKLKGYFHNWKEEWQSASDLLDKLKKESEDEDND